MRITPTIHALEYLITLLFFYVMRALPMPVASACAGAIARAIGPMIGRSRLARAQMQAHLLACTDAETEGLLRDMWENLGRVFGEYPHMHRAVMAPRIQISGAEHLPQNAAPFLVVSGHIGNWEIIPRALSMMGKPVHVVYRPPNNPYTHGMIDRIRRRYSLGHYGKGREGAKGVMGAFQAGESVAMLIDQKDNAGALLDFMGSPAMTMTSAAKLALKFNIAVVPCFIERTQGARFHVHFQPALTPPSADEIGEDARALALMQAMNDAIAKWVRAHPAQWFWLHRRWPKSKEAT